MKFSDILARLEKKFAAFFGTDREWSISALFYLVAGALFLFIWGMGSYPLWDPWEPKYAQAMREMIASGDYISPTLDGYVRWTKPILFYWTMLVPMLIGGNNEFTARLPSAIAALSGVLVVYYVLNRLRGRRTAFIGAAILATIPQYFYMARQAMPDMLMTFFITSAMGFFALARFEQARRKLHLMLFYAAVGLALLTKGPLTAVIILGSLCLFWLVDYGEFFRQPFRWSAKKIIKEYYIIPGIVIILVIAMPWYLAMLFRHGNAYVEYFIGSENIERFSRPIRGHHGILTYHVRALFHGMYPWAGFLPPALIFYFRRLETVDEEWKQRWYFLSWFLAIFLIFTIAGTKQPYYLLPITPLVAVIVALFWERYFDERNGAWLRPALLLAIAFTLLPIRDFLLEDSKYIFAVFTLPYSLVGIEYSAFLKAIFAAWALVLLLACFQRRAMTVFVLALLIAYANGIFFVNHVMPQHSKDRSMKYYIERFQHEKGDNGQLLYFGRRTLYSMYYYFDRSKYRTYRRGERHDLLADIAENRDRDVFVIARNRYLGGLQDLLDDELGATWSVVSRKHNRYTLLRINPAAGPDTSPRL